MTGFYRTDPGQPKAAIPAPLSMRPREAAAALGISPKTLERLTKAGKIQALKIGTSAAKRRGGSITIYEVDELRAYLDRCRQSAGRAEA
jgi:excisionase family DNA binding protein